MKNEKYIEDGNAFLSDFLKSGMYLQNPPMVTEDFINYCEKLGVCASEEELEFFEKEKLFFPIIRVDRPVEVNEKIKFKGADGLEYLQSVEFGLQEGETEIERIKVKSYAFYNLFKEDIKGSNYKDRLVSWFEEGHLFEPASREFQSWDTFRGEDLEGERHKIVSFYSNLQIWQLNKLKQITGVTFTQEKSTFYVDDRDLSFEEGKIYLNLKVKVELYDEAETRQLERPFKSNQEIKAVVERFRSALYLNAIRENWDRHNEFHKFLKFLLSVQSIYIPYSKSGSGKIQISIDHEKWAELKHNFKLDKILEKLDMKIEDVAKWYKIFADEAQRILGIKRDDWVQLLKSISWDKKDNLEGHTRLGLEYLHWAIMLKRILEEHLHKKVVDIDELSGILYADVLKCETGQYNQFKASEDKQISQKVKGYGDRHKRLFYLANKFGLDYQPRVTVYVEGKTEEIVFPETYEDFFGVEPENLGIEFINIRGISQFFGRRTSLKTHHGNYKKKFVSNFKNLASYNLNKWQIIPFFMGDDENDISNLMESGITIAFNGKQFAFPKEWQHIWGITNNNKPFQGKDFEMANFNDEELATASSEVLGKHIKTAEVESKRNSGEGLKQVNEEINKHKIDIARKLYSNLLDRHERTRDDSLFERPIFAVFRKIRELAVLNHPPTSQKIQLKNKEYIEGILQKNTRLT